MAQPHVLILRARNQLRSRNGIRVRAGWGEGGGPPRKPHPGKSSVFDRFQILCVPGGFSYGDDVAAGRILANQIQHHLFPQLAKFRDSGKLVLGICNGFQVLIKSGILLEANGSGPPATLTWNDSGRYEDRWVQLESSGNPSVFLAGIDRMYLPVAHAEGKFVTRDDETLSELEQAGRLVLRYRPLQTATASPEAPVPYPDNPNGSMGNVAGVCDSNGRVLGLMPHPERHIDPVQHPRRTRAEAGSTGDGLRLFVNAVKYFE